MVQSDLIDAGGLTPNTAYFYRCYGSNDSGSIWADGFTNFLTGQVMKLSKGKANPKLVTETILGKLQ